MSCLQCDAFNKEAASRRRHRQSGRSDHGFHPENKHYDDGGCGRFTATPLWRKTTPEGAVVAGTNRSCAGLSSDMTHTQTNHPQLHTIHTMVANSPESMAGCHPAVALPQQLAPCRRRAAFHSTSAARRIAVEPEAGVACTSPDRARAAQIEPAWRRQLATAAHLPSAERRAPGALRPPPRRREAGAKPTADLGGIPDPRPTASTHHP